MLAGKCPAFILYGYLHLYLQVPNEVCWEEPREHCTEQKMKVAKKWCVEEDDSKKKLF